MQEINTYLSSIWLNTKESKIFVTLYQLGSSPASTVASIAQTERVRTYKCLVKFAEMGIIAHSIKQKVKHFWIPSLDLLHHYITRNQQTRSDLQHTFPTIKTLFESYHQTWRQAPNIQIYDGVQAMRHIYRDMLSTLSQSHILHIKLFATNTFDTQMMSVKHITDYSGDFFDQLDTRKIHIESYIAQWSLIMEQLQREDTIDTIKQLPAGNNAINLYLIGQIVYIIIYKNPPIWLKIESPELAWALHFLLEQTVK